jgi:hypothetical protein
MEMYCSGGVDCVGVVLKSQLAGVCFTHIRIRDDYLTA